MGSQTRSTLIAVAVLLGLFAAGTYVAFELVTDRGLPLVPSPGRVAVVPVEGTLSADRGVAEALRRYREDGSVEGVVLKIQSPGGTVGATQAAYRELRALRDEGRPVVAWIGDVGASGGYYAAVAADSIFALPGSITGSIGVIMQFPNLEGTLDRIGLRMDVVKSGALKDAGSPYRALGEDDREVFRRLVDDAYGQFVDAVAEGRGLEPERARELADGRVVSGERAVELGLVDGVSTFSEALDAAGRMSGLGEDPRTVTPREGRFDLLDLLDGVSRSRIEGWVESWLGWSPGRGGAPRLLYLWR
ncbi:MAG: signal peptide peptidase SppA [Gemmatimonadota bacterium]